MKNLITIIITLTSIISLVLHGCSSDEKTSPTDSTPPPEILVDSDTIGIGGGEFDTDNFTLTVPAGAIDSTVSLVLYTTTETAPFGEETVAPTYKINGFPTEFDDTLKLRIKYDSALTYNNFISLAEEVFVSSMNRMDTIFHLFDAVDSSGYLLCQIPPATGSKSAFKPGVSFGSNEPAASVSMIISAISGYLKYNSSGGHFRIAYPFKSVTPSSAIELGGYLEEAYSDFQTVGFSYTARTSWPMKVTIKSLSANVLGWAASSPLGINYDEMAFSSAWVTSSAEIRTTAGHEYFHSVQAMYDTTRSAMSKSKGWWYTHYWLDEAASTWSEEMFTASANYVSLAFSGREDEPLKGIHAGIAGGRDDIHGYGMAPLLKDLFTQSADGNAFIVDVYENIRTGDHPVKAIIDAYGSEPDNWLTGFFARYLQGTYYSVLADNFITANVDTFDVGAADYTTTSISMPYPDLSPALFVINTDNPDFDSEDSVKLVATAAGHHPDIIVFKHKLGSWQLLFNQPDSVTVGDLPVLALGGWDLVAVVVNDWYTAPGYNTNTDVEFTVQLIDNLDLSIFKRFGFSYQIYGHWLNDYDSTYEMDHNSIYCCRAYGGFTNGVFESDWDTTFVSGSSDTTHSKGWILAVFNQSTNKLTGYTVVDTTYTSSNGYYRATRVEGANLSLTYQDASHLYFGAIQSDVCNSISVFQYKSFDIDSWQEVQSIDCNTESDIDIVFYDD